MKLVTVLLSMFALVVSGCAAPGREYVMAYSVTISPEFTADETEQVIAAIDIWTAAVPGLTMPYTIGACGDIETTACVVASHDMGKFEGMTQEGRSGGRVEIFVSKIASDRTPLRLAVAHELGHVMMGPDHLGRGTLMAAISSGITEISAKDIAHFHAAR